MLVIYKIGIDKKKNSYIWFYPTQKSDVVFECIDIFKRWRCKWEF